MLVLLYSAVVHLAYSHIFPLFSTCRILATHFLPAVSAMPYLFSPSNHQFSQMSDECLIYVADFHPAHDANLNHWVLWICSEPAAGLGVSIDVDGSSRHWGKRVSNRHNPTGSSHFHAIVEVGAIESEKVPKLVRYIDRNFNVNNTNDNWNCQSYITDIVRDLEEQGICDKGIAANLRIKLRSAGRTRG
jgi:hypothetical protein